MASWRVACAIVAVLGACANEKDDRPSREECVTLRDHVAALTIAQSSASLSPEMAEAHRENVAASGGEASIEECTKARSREFVACGLAARNLDELKRCRGNR